jgi:uncharacterized protein (TIGR00297 family)
MCLYPLSPTIYHMPPLIALAVGGACAVLAWRLRWLTLDGAVAAGIVGAAVLAGGGWPWGLTLAVFVASGSLLTLVGRHRKSQGEHTGAGRTAGQVLATGGLAAIAGVAQAFAGPESPWGVYATPVFFGSLAAVTADTWATELGMLSAQPPVLITSGRQVEPGTSGGVTAAGTAAGVAGAAAIALCGFLFTPPAARLFGAVTVSGIAGMLVDSLLGATLQGVFAAPGGETTEDGSPGARLVRGWAWMTNPVVNLFAAATAGVAAVLLSARH